MTNQVVCHLGSRSARNRCRWAFKPTILAIHCCNVIRIDPDNATQRATLPRISTRLEPEYGGRTAPGRFAHAAQATHCGDSATGHKSRETEARASTGARWNCTGRRISLTPAMVLIDIRGEARGRFCSAWLSTMGLVSADEQPQSCADARPAEIGRHDHFDRFRQDVELTQTRQGPARHIVRFE